MNYYIVDMHFGHDNIRRLSNRPFATIEEMSKAIIDNWNSRVIDIDFVPRTLREILEMKNWL